MKYIVTLKKGYTDIVFSFDNMDDAAVFIDTLLNSTDDEIKVEIIAEKVELEVM